MNFNKKNLALVFSFTALSGCGGASDPSTEIVAVPATINALDISVELTEHDRLLRAVINCTNCLESSHQYSWSIDDVIVSTSDVFVLKDQDLDKEIRIEVSINNNDNFTKK